MALEAFEKALKAGARDKRALHQIITGVTGSGKTTAADEYAQSLFEQGLVQKKEPVRCNGHLLGLDFTSGTEKTIEQLVEQSRGGVLIIDEPQAASENVAVLLKMASIKKDGPVVILTANTDEIKSFMISLQNNPAVTLRYPNFNKPIDMGPQNWRTAKPAKPAP
jgi:hypothetical protein